MNEITIAEDIKARAEAFLVGMNFLPSTLENGIPSVSEKDVVDYITRTFLAEREAATKAERERCAGIADEYHAIWSRLTPETGAKIRAGAGMEIATAIRSGASL